VKRKKVFWKLDSFLKRGECSRRGDNATENELGISHICSSLSERAAKPARVQMHEVNAETLVL
jgi:hypothetical protein